MSDRHLTVTLRADTRTLDEMMRDVQAKLEDVKRRLGEAFALIAWDLYREVMAWWNAYPGMPYTKPSLWDADQMKADR